MDQPQRRQSGHSSLDRCGIDHAVWLRHCGRSWQGLDVHGRMDQGQNRRGQEMKGFILGTVFGIVIGTVGLSGITRILDTSIAKVQEVSKEAANNW